MKLRLLLARLGDALFDWWVDDLRLSPHLEEWKPGAQARIRDTATRIMEGIPVHLPLSSRFRMAHVGMLKAFPWMCGERVSHHLACHFPAFVRF